MSDAVRCPSCGESNSVIPIAYGMPDQESMEKSERGEILLGGCLITICQPTHFCKSCDEKFIVAADSLT
jgi:hypothetical protein